MEGLLSTGHTPWQWLFVLIQCLLSKDLVQFELVNHLPFNILILLTTIKMSIVTLYCYFVSHIPWLWLIIKIQLPAECQIHHLNIVVSLKSKPLNIPQNKKSSFQQPKNIIEFKTQAVVV